MTATLVTDGFKDETPKPRPESKATGLHHIVYGKDSYVDTLDESTINALLVTAVIKKIAEVKYPGGRTYLYVSLEGTPPKEFS